MTTESVVTSRPSCVSPSEYPLCVIGCSRRSARRSGDTLELRGPAEPRAESEEEISRT
jgi:hypothetical protein